MALAGSSLRALSFQLRVCTLVGSAPCSSSSLLLDKNPPPHGGTLSVYPPLGDALATQFQFSASNWVDSASDLPLQYSFGYYVVEGWPLVVVKSLDAVAIASAFVGPGAAANYFRVTCVVVVKDTMGAAANATDAVVVSPTASVPAALSTVATSTSLSLAASDYSAFYATVSAGLQTVNYADCSASPPCAGRNRLACMGTMGTCGACLSGFIGREGDSNLPCNSSLASIGAACATHSHCASNLCNRQVCVDREKECVNDCSGRGECVFQNSYGQRIESCLLSDAYCNALCNCSAGFFGKDCSLSLSSYESSIMFREYSCQSIRSAFPQVLKQKAVTTDLLENHLNTLISVFSDYSLVSKYALLNCSIAIVGATTIDPTISCRESIPSLLVQAVSAALKTISISFPSEETLFNALINAVSSHSASCGKALINGQSPLLFPTDGLRIYSAAIAPSAAEGNYSLSLPQSTWEGLLHSPRPRVTVRIDSSIALSSLNIFAAEYVRSAVRADVHANMSAALSIHLEARFIHQVSERRVRRRGRARRESGRKLQEESVGVTVQFSLPNKSPVAYFSIPASTLLFSCHEESNAAYRLNGSCPDGQSLRTLLCPANARGEYRVRCPGFATIPSLKMWNGSAYLPSNLCHVTRFDSQSSHVTCEGSFRATNHSSFAGEFLTDLDRHFLSGGSEPTIEFISFGTSSSLSLDKSYKVILSSTLAGIGCGLLVVLLSLFLFEQFDQGKKSSKYSIDEDKEQFRESSRSIHEFYLSLFPEIFQSLPRRVIFLRELRSTHAWLRPFNLATAESRVLLWIHAASTILVCVFFSVITLRMFHLLDDEDYRACRGVDNALDCEGLRRRCSWENDSGYCVYSHRPSVETVISLIVYTTLLSIATNAVIGGAIDHVKTHLTRLRRVTRSSVSPISPRQLMPSMPPMPSSPSLVQRSRLEIDVDEIQFKDVPLSPFSDEFQSLLLKKDKVLLLAARVAKLKQSIDLSSAANEANQIQSIVSKYERDNQNEEVVKNLRAFLPMDYSIHGLYWILGIFDAREFSLKEWMCLLKVSKARTASDRLFDLLRAASEDRGKERLLMRGFFVDVLSGYKRTLLQKIVFADSPTATPREGSIYMVVLLIGLVTSALGAMVFVIYSQLSRFESYLTIQLFFIVLGVSFAQDFFLFRVFVIWMDSIVEKQVLRSTLAPSIPFMAALSRIALMRTSGMMTMSNGLGE